MITKSPYGSPCNNCGFCCREELCALAEIAFPGAVAPCPALETDGDRQTCGLIANPARYAPIRTAIHGVDAMRESAAQAVGAGVGCDSQLFEERGVIPPREYTAALDKFRPQKAAVVRKIVRLWGDRSRKAGDV